MDIFWDFALRLFVAGAMGVLIGLEREYRAKEAGYRTHFLVALGSALMMIVSQYGFMEVLKTDLIRLDQESDCCTGSEWNWFYRCWNNYFAEADC